MTEEQLAVAGAPQDPAVVYETDDTSLVKIYNAELDAYGEAPRSGVKFLAGWEIVDPTPEEAAAVAPFDPQDFAPSEVVERLQNPGVSDAERQAVLSLERAGKNRVTILRKFDAEQSNNPDVTPTDEGSPGA